MPNIAENRSVGKTEQDIRAKLALLRARYDSGAVPQGLFAVIRRLEIELAWVEHRKRSTLPRTEYSRRAPR
jgi:hypothetical protein